MGDAAIFIGFGRPARARELQALELFKDALALYQQLRERGEIESVEPVLLEPHGGDLGGFFLVRGSREQLQRLRTLEEFRRVNARAGLVVDNFGVVDGYLGAGLEAQLALYGQQVNEQLSA